MDEPFPFTCCGCMKSRKNNNWPKVKSVCIICKKSIKRNFGTRTFHFKCDDCNK